MTRNAGERLPRTLSRRSLLATAGAAGIAAPIAARRVGAQESPPIEPTGDERPEPVGDPEGAEPQLPAESGDQSISQGEASELEVGNSRYFAQTGHNVTDPFSNVWQQLGGEDVFGLPLSESYVVEGEGTLQQEFEALALAYDPDDAQADAVWVVPLDEEIVNQVASSSALQQVSGATGAEPNEQYFPETGHTVSGGFAEFWWAHGETTTFGFPLTEPYQEGEVTAQVFQNGVLEERDGSVQPRAIRREIVEAEGREAESAFVPAPPNLGVATMVEASDGLSLRSAPSMDGEVLFLLPDGAEFIAVPGDHDEWIPGYVDGMSGWVSAEWLVEPESLPAVALQDWQIDEWQGAALGMTNVRAEPTTESRSVRELSHGERVTVLEWLDGEEVHEASSIWARLDDGNYVYARNIGRAAPVEPPPVPDDLPWEGRWIDVHLTQQLMVAYEGREPVRTCVTTTGMPGWETPPGWYTINWRVANETMTSEAIGAEHYHRLEDVLFTQYFTDIGHAFHLAWWRTPETIGRPGSHGCLNLLLDDARFFWEWADIGTSVIIR